MLFERERHIRYFVHCLKSLPSEYTSLDTNRLTLVHFAIHSLDLLGFFDHDELPQKYQVEKQGIIDWIYSLQTLTSTSNNDSNAVKIEGVKLNDSETKNESGNEFFTENQIDDGHTYWKHVGFKGGTFLGGKFQTVKSTNEGQCYEGWIYDHGHIAMTYTALCTLSALGDDLGRCEKVGIIKAIKNLQLEDGSFKCISEGSESDMRFLYCACAISHMLNDWSGVDIPKAVNYIRSCRSWDGAISLIPGQEGHGGSTFCGIASLVLMGKLQDFLNEGNSGGGWEKDLIKWCVSRQIGGMQGRPNKAEDTCYSYWIGGTLHLLGVDNLLDQHELRRFVLGCQTDMGGFSKLEGSFYPDLLHSFYSMAWLSLYSRGKKSTDNNDSFAYNCNGTYDNEENMSLKELDCAVGICKERLNIFRP